MVNYFQLAVNTWRQRGVKLLPPPKPHVLDHAFAELNIPLSAELRRFYSITGGFADFACDSCNLWSLWSIERMLNENQENTSPCPWFADSMICFHLYSFKHISNAETMVVIDDALADEAPTHIVGRNLTEFLQRYLADPDSVKAY